jgi:ParB-like chromosome segregation protein Spo0J
VEIKAESRQNLRDDLGDLTDLKDSLLERKGNLIPIGVSRKGDFFRLEYGFRRYEAAKQIGLEELNAVIYDPKDERERFLLKYHENIGRKDLDWKEEAKALKLKLQFESKFHDKDNFVSNEAQERNVASRSVLRILEAAKAIEEYPALEEESNRTNALRKYQELKKLDDGQKERIKLGGLAINEALAKEKKKRIIDSSEAKNILVHELKKEVIHYKKQAEDLKNQLTIQMMRDLLTKAPKEDRIEVGIWFENEEIGRAHV